MKAQIPRKELKRKGQTITQDNHKKPIYLKPLKFPPSQSKERKSSTDQSKSSPSFLVNCISSKLKKIKEQAKQRIGFGSNSVQDVVADAIKSLSRIFKKKLRGKKET